MKILLVDDNPFFLEVSKMYLEVFHDILSDAVESPLDALQKLENESYDAVVSDYEMPSMNGIAFLRALRKNNNNIPFILFTGKDRDSIVFESAEAGVSFYLQKGGDPKLQYSELSRYIRVVAGNNIYEK